jgi:hypothetical protein
MLKGWQAFWLIFRSLVAPGSGGFKAESQWLQDGAVRSSFIRLQQPLHPGVRVTFSVEKLGWRRTTPLAQPYDT